MYEMKTGRALGTAPYIHPVPLVSIALSQGASSGSGPFGTLSDRRLALLDASGDLFIMPIVSAAGGGGQSARQANSGQGGWPLPLKLAANADSFRWAETYDALLALADGAALLWLWPHAAAADAELALAARVTLPLAQGALGSAPVLIAHAGSRAIVARGDGARIYVTTSPFAAALHEAAGAGRWEEAVRLARLAQSAHVWAALAALALTARQLDAAEFALAAMGAIDKLQFVRHIKKQVREERDARGETDADWPGRGAVTEARLGAKLGLAPRSAKRLSLNAARKLHGRTPIPEREAKCEAKRFAPRRLAPAPSALTPSPPPGPPRNSIRRNVRAPTTTPGRSRRPPPLSNTPPRLPRLQDQHPSGSVAARTGDCAIFAMPRRHCTVLPSAAPPSGGRCRNARRFPSSLHTPADRTY